MSLVNEVRCIGHLGNDATKNSTTNGKFAINFRLGVDDSFKRADGTWDNKTIWYECVLWADRKIDDLKSGNMVLVTGTPRPNEYTKSDGTKGFGMRITVEGLKVLKFKDPLPQANPQPSAPTAATPPTVDGPDW